MSVDISSQTLLPPILPLNQINMCNRHSLYVCEPYNGLDVKSKLQFQYVFSNLDTQLYVLVLELILKPIPKNHRQHMFMKSQITNYLNSIIGQANYCVIHPNKMPVNDVDVYTHLHHIMNTSIYPIIGYPQNENYGRSMSRVHDIMALLHSKYSVFDNTNKLEPLHFVDIGCSMGEITKELARVLHTPYGVGIDILHSSQVIYQHNDDGLKAFEYIQIDQDTNALPFKNGSQDIVLAVMSLHHIQHVDKCLAEVARILKRGGLFIIQEHSPNNRDECIALDILHGLYSMVWAPIGNQEQPYFCDVYDANYKSKWEWMELLQNYGFEIHVPKMSFKSIPKHNPFGNFWAIANICS